MQSRRSNAPETLRAHPIPPLTHRAGIPTIPPMSLAQLRDDWISPEEYLESELKSEVRREYLGGYLHSMPDSSEQHCLVAGNILVALHEHLRGKPCRVFGNSMKCRIQSVGRDVFYYPDVMVTCGPRSKTDYFKRDPVIIFEVLSPSTVSTDRREKFFAYTSLPTLDAYVLVEQEKIGVTVFRRSGEGWATEEIEGRDGVLALPRIEMELPLTLIYEEVL